MLKRIIVAVGGSSGSIYAKVLFDRLLTLSTQWERVGVVMSDNAKYNWKLELGNEAYNGYPFDFYEKADFMAPFASGSARYELMIVCPSAVPEMPDVAD